MAAVRSMRETSKANGNGEMTLDEINQEITAAKWLENGINAVIDANAKRIPKPCFKGN